MKKVALLGSTGSIGKSTLKVIENHPDKFQVEGLAAGSNTELLYEQVKLFRPKVVAVYDEDKARELQKRLPHIQVLSGMEGLLAVAVSGDITVCAISGSIGLLPTIEAIKAGKIIALANKEVLVCGGEYVMHLAKKHQVPILPVDSEHSALFQCLNGEKTQHLRRMILTASGGPFRNFSQEQLQKVTLEQALKHPTWNMGAKITVDSSTLMNKGLEVIEARWLFDVDPNAIEVVVHPQSIIHSMVEFIDGSILAQMSEPDMVLPIQYALSYPERIKGTLRPFDFTKAHALEFFPPDLNKFKCLDLAFKSLEMGGSASCFLNAANEELVSLFLKRAISWIDIPYHLERLLEQHVPVLIDSVDDILAMDAEGRRSVACLENKAIF